MENYSYSLLTVNNLDGLNELYKSSFGRDQFEDVFRWKYFNNPAGSAVVAGAFYENRLVASGAMIPERMYLFGLEQLVFKCTDLMTHPEHQQKGLSKKISSLLNHRIGEHKVQLSYTLCSAISTKSFLRNDWNYLGKTVNYFRPRLLIKIKGLFKRNTIKRCKIFSSVDGCFDSYDFKFDGSKISIKKSSEFIKWRTSNPKFSYRIICSYDLDDKVNGYLIFSYSLNKTLNVIDIESLEFDAEVLNSLLEFAEEIVINQGLRGIVIFSIEKTPFYEYIKKKNYLRNPVKIGPLKSALDLNFLHLSSEAKGNLLDVTIWDINGLSYDDI